MSPGVRAGADVLHPPAAGLVPPKVRPGAREEVELQEHPAARGSRGKHFDESLVVDRAQEDL